MYKKKKRLNKINEYKLKLWLIKRERSCQTHKSTVVGSDDTIGWWGALKKTPHLVSVIRIMTKTFYF